MSTRREFLIQTAAAGVVVASSVQMARAAAKDTGSGPKTPMKTTKVPHTDLTVSRIAYGSAVLGMHWRSPDFVAKNALAIRTAYDNGITFFDTADIYAGGQSEMALGQVLKDSPGLRDKIVIQSKSGQRIRAGWAPGDPFSAGIVSVDLSRDHIVNGAEGSLKRLGTDRLDILLLHVPLALVEPEEVAKAFDELHRSGKVRYFGVCMHSAVQIELLKKYVRQPLVINQIQLSLARYAPMEDKSGFGSIVDYCRLHEMQVQAYSPLKGDNIMQKPALLGAPADPSPEVKQMAQVLDELAKKYAVSPAAIMLAWLLRHPAGIVPILGANSPQHIVEDCAADRVELTSEEWQILFNTAAGIQPK